MLPFLNLWSVLILLGAVQGLFLSWTFFFSPLGQPLSNRLLGLLLLALVAAERQRYLLLAVGLAAFCFYYWGDDYYYALVGEAIKRAVQGLNCWCWVLVCIGFGRRYLNRNSPLLQLANEAVYPFYILHQTVLIALAYYVLQWPATAAAKFLLIALGTFGGTLLLYSVIWRFSVLRVLFGLKPRRVLAAGLRPR